MSFRGIYGHEREIEILRRAIVNDRTAHAYVFAGPEGVGKRLVAFTLAKVLNCERAEKDDFCGRCSDCVQMDEMTHMNLFYTEPVDGVIRIDTIRELQGVLRYRAIRGRKVAIVDGADRMGRACANAFLKTLEEPPPDSMVILISSKPADLLPTVLSRCQRINFSILSEDTVFRILREKEGLNDRDARRIAVLSSGSMSLALKNMDVEAHARRKELLQEILSLTPLDGDRIVDLAGELSKRPDLEDVLEHIKSSFRDMAVFYEGMGRLVVNRDLVGLFEARGYVPFENLYECFRWVERMHMDILPPRYANRELSMELMLINIARNLSRV